MKKKRFYLFMCILVASILFSSCGGFWLDVISESISRIDTLKVYYPENGKESTSLKTTVGGSKQAKVKVIFKKRYDYDLGTYYYETSDQCDLEIYSSNESVATVSIDETTVDNTSFGYNEFVITIKGKSEGTCTITVCEKGKESKSATLKVTVEKGLGVFLKQKTLNLFVGQTETLNYENTYDNYTPYWGSSNSYVAKVDAAGKVTGVKAGSAVITVKSRDGKKTDTCNVTVVEKKWSVKINTSTVPTTIYPQDSFIMTANIVVDSGYSKELVWKSSDSSVLAIDSTTGKATAKSEGKAVITASLVADDTIKDTYEVYVSKAPVACNQFFWGTWIRMDNGKTYVVEEQEVTYEGRSYSIISSTDKEVVISTIGTFNRDSENTIKYFDKSKDIEVPFFRKGGTNLKYKVRVVGFEEGGANRAAGTTITGKPGIKVIGQSDKYSSFTDEGITDENGEVELIAPVQGDTETIKIEIAGKADPIIIPGLKIENDGANMGTIPIVDENDYSLKITGTIADSAKTNGYLYGNNYKNYPLALTITNISEKLTATSVAELSCDDPNFSFVIQNSEDVNKATISSLPPNLTKQINVSVAYGNLESAFKDVELKITIKNLKSGRVWVDYVPLRFFAGDMPISIGTKCIEGSNKNANLNGFLIYPDGNSSYFSVRTGYSKQIYVPIFGSQYNYKMVFCGATIQEKLDNSTEMFYSVALDQIKTLNISTSAETLERIYSFGEPNDTEDAAWTITDSEFDAYLDLNDIDYYLIPSVSNSKIPHLN